MLDAKRYNGWTNYATWRVNLEMFDGYPIDHFDFEDPKDLEDHLREELDNLLDCINDDVLRGWARAFAEDANLLEIAEHMLSEE